jgi:multimeric flavodoxin WrbA
MKVLGISGSPRNAHTTDLLVQEVLKGVECETEFISLAGKCIAPCTACLGCAKTNECILNDDMKELRPKIIEADAYVIGAPNYFAMLNGLTHSFMERWYQFRHRSGKSVAGKLGVAVGVGGGSPAEPTANVRSFFEYNQIECVGAVTAQGAASCFTCGYGEGCEVGAIHMFFGAGTKITEEMTPALSKQPDKMEKAQALGKQLNDRLKRFAQAT